MKHKITTKWGVSADLCFTVEIGGNSFTVIYGQYINGGWCAIPNWKISCDVGEPDDIGYNGAALLKAFEQAGYAELNYVDITHEIASALAEVSKPDCKAPFVRDLNHLADAYKAQEGAE